MEPVIIVVFWSVVLVAVVVGINLAARQRRKGLAALAQRVGMMFSPYADYQMAERFAFLNKLAQGSNRYALNMLWGNFRNHAVYAFDYHYETTSWSPSEGRETTDHYFGCMVLMLERRFPELMIGPEGFLSQLAQCLGYEDIDFESHEFSRTFCVRSKDKKFAYDFCHPRLMEYLLRNPLCIEVEGSALAITFSGRLDPAQVEYNLNRLVHLRSLMPKYLFSSDQAAREGQRLAQ